MKKIDELKVPYTDEQYSAFADKCNENNWRVEIQENKDAYAYCFTDEELTQQARIQEVYELKQYLADTDYIYNVIEEGDATVEYYAEVIAKRKQARARIRELENDV